MAKRKKLPATLSEQLRELIGAAGPSAYELARDAGVDRSVLSRFLTGKRTITLETADRLAAVLKLRLIAGR
jgi:transcriptional regulator with XRE-family HTH domain